VSYVLQYRSSRALAKAFIFVRRPASNVGKSADAGEATKPR
jgi:hypothetical protein